MTCKLMSTLLLFLPLAAFMSADENPHRPSPDGYAYGFTTCFQGSDGTGVSLRLTTHPGCSRKTYPYLEIHIGEQPIPTNKRLLIGDKNSAFRCLDAKSACQWFTSGEFLFTRFQEVDKEGIHTTGWYQLRFASAPPETGRFTADCIAPCA